MRLLSALAISLLLQPGVPLSRPPGGVTVRSEASRTPAWRMPRPPGMPGWDETWGLVVNEALNFALPVIVSDKVGSAEDLVRSGWNGFVVPHADVGALARALGLLVSEPPAVRAELGARGRDLVEAYSVERCANGIVEACHRARAARRRVGA